MALVEGIGVQAKHNVLPIVSDGEISAQDNLLRFLATLEQQQRANKDVLLTCLPMRNADENAHFRHKLSLDFADYRAGSRETATDMHRCLPQRQHIPWRSRPRECMRPAFDRPRSPSYGTV